MLETIVKAISDKKGEDIIAIDVSNSSPMCDYIVVCSASNERQLVSIANSIDEELYKNNYEIKAIGTMWHCLNKE